MTRDELVSRLRDVRCFVLDMDGTIYLGDTLFPFTRDFLRQAEASGRRACFFTNNSSRNATFYLQKLSRLGIDVPPQAMFTANQVAAEYLAERAPQGVYLVGTPSLREDFQEAGIPLDSGRPDAVVVGFDTTLTYEKLRRACDLVRGGASFYGVNPDYNCPVENGGMMPDCGSICRIVEASTGVKPAFFGKPSPLVLEHIARRTGCRAGELAVVGDRLYTDIALAHGTDALSILVLTGEATREDAGLSPTPPDWIAESLAEIAVMLADMAAGE